MDSSLFKYKKSPDVRTTTSFTLRKKFVTNLGLMIFLNLLIKPLWIFGIDRHVHNLVGDDEFGFYQTLLNFSMLTIVTLDFGLTNFNNRNISQNHELIKKHFSNLVGLKFLLAIVYAIVIFSIALIMDYTDPRQIKLLGFLAFNQFLISFTLYLRSNISGLQLYKTNSFLSVLDRGLMLIICSIILFFGLPGVNFSIELYVFAQTSAYVITAIITFFIVFSKSGSFKINFNKVFYIAILKKIYPFALLALLMTLYTYIDQNMLNKLLPDGEGDKYVGIYYQGFRIFNAAYQFGLLFAFLLLPMFAKMIKQKESIHQMVLLSSVLLIVPSIILAFVCAFYSGDIMGILHTNNVQESAEFFGIFMFAFVSLATTIIFGTLLTANGSLKEMNWIAGIALLINIIINLILIPRFYAKGAAIACLATQSFVAIAQIVVSVKLLKLKVNYRVIFLLLIFSAGLLALCILVKSLNIEWYIGFGTIIITGMIFAILIRLLNLKVIYQILKFGDQQ